MSGLHPLTKESTMNISKANAATLGHILADALHQCDNLAERKGVLRARDAILDVLERDCQQSDADWQRYCAFTNRFDDRLNHLEPRSQSCRN